MAKVLGNVASGSVPALGVIAALNQPHVAASSQYGNGSQPSDESGERYGATRV